MHQMGEQYCNLLLTKQVYNIINESVFQNGLGATKEYNNLNYIKYGRNGPKRNHCIKDDDTQDTNKAYTIQRITINAVSVIQYIYISVMKVFTRHICINYSPIFLQQYVIVF